MALVPSSRAIFIKWICFVQSYIFTYIFIRLSCFETCHSIHLCINNASQWSLIYQIIVYVTGKCYQRQWVPESSSAEGICWYVVWSCQSYTTCPWSVWLLVPRLVQCLRMLTASLDGISSHLSTSLCCCTITVSCLSLLESWVWLTVLFLFIFTSGSYCGPGSSYWYDWDSFWLCL